MGSRKLKNLKTKSNIDTQPATDDSLIDWFSKRVVRQHGDSFIDFIMKFELKKGSLVERKNKNVIILTMPRVTYNPEIQQNIKTIATIK
jgi:hypothetical protein